MCDMTRRYMRKKCKETDTFKIKKKFKCDMTFDMCVALHLYMCDMTRRYMRKKCKETDTSKSKKKFKCDMTFVCFFTLFICDMTRPYEWNKGGLRLVGSLKLQVCFAEYRVFYRALLQKRPVFLRS